MELEVMAALDTRFLLRFVLLDQMKSTEDLYMQKDRNGEHWGTHTSLSKLRNDMVEPPT